jgi:small subunit ribosomal protein S3
VGQKVNPRGFRVGVYQGWSSRWFARDSYANAAYEDIIIRKTIHKQLVGAEIDRIEIERAGDAVKVVIFSARPGVVIGKRGQEIEMIRRNLAKVLKKDVVEVSVQEVKNPELSANIVARDIADQLERRASFKKVMKKAASSALRAGARGVKICTAGRLGGAEIARDEWVRVGSTPLHTIRADIDYGFATAQTTYGIIGVKVWICRGDFKVS